MYNHNIKIEITQVRPFHNGKNYDRIAGIIIQGEVKDRPFFHLRHFEGKDPKKINLRLRCFGKNTCQVLIMDIKYGYTMIPGVKGITSAMLTFNVKTNDENLVKKFIDSINEIITINIQQIQK